MTTRRSRAATIVTPWSALDDAQLLQYRFCDLQLSLSGAPVESAIARLHRELDARAISFKPHAWLAEEWFSPDGVPGIAIPFYLAHPRLVQLERRMMGSVEGGNANWMMRILRHEAGHAIDTAYRLRRRRIWRETFGYASSPYPDRYRARPSSRRYVHHLGDWYAQAHPTEDFAETFAVWLKPRSNWRHDYAGWPALHKLLTVDRFMQEIREVPAPVRARDEIEPLELNTRTLAQYYRGRRAREQRFRSSLTDRLLREAFTDAPARHNAILVATLLRENRAALAVGVMRDLKLAPEPGFGRYSAYQVLRIAIDRSVILKLRIRGSRRDALAAARTLLRRLTRSYLSIETPQLPL